VTGNWLASAAMLPGQPVTMPLWLNSHRPLDNGEQAISVTGMPTVAERTAASTAPLCTAPASAANEVSAQIGIARRYRIGVVAPSGYQPAPNPSALTTASQRISPGA
jgi:hypothetical protein